MKIASLQYRYDFPKDFNAYKKKISQLVKRHEDEGVDLLVFPEYAGLEMLSFSSLEDLSNDPSTYIDLFQELSYRHHMMICCGTQIVKEKGASFNRSYFFSPSKKCAYQDKCFLTPSEIDEGILSKSKIQRLFETPFGKIGICICYDVEFPFLVRNLVDAGAVLILIPSCASTIHGFYRVFLSCRARALENQCYVVQSALVGQTDVEIAYGASSICGPIDDGFPHDGLIAKGQMDQLESVIAELDLRKLEQVRASGQTHNFKDAKNFNLQSIHLETIRGDYERCYKSRPLHRTKSKELDPSNR